MQQVTIIGCGDIGERVAKIWYSRGLPVHVVVRNTERAQYLSNQNFDVILADLDRDDLSHIPSENQWLFWFAPPGLDGCEDSRIRRWLMGLDEKSLPKKIVYISTSGVYGDCQGAWVDESTPVNPQSERAKRRVDAEQQLSAWCERHQVPYVILRVPGIYGPGRWPIATIKRAQPVLKRAESPFSNRIHQDDLAQICVAAMLRKEGVGIINVGDGQQSTMSDYFQSVAKAFDLPIPKEVSWDEAQRVLSPGMLSYLTESRRINNQKMLTSLNIKLRYPTLEDALRDDVCCEG